MTEQEFFSGIQSDNADLRYAAWSKADQMDATVIPQLMKLLVAEQPGVRKAADEALNNIVHSAGKEAGGTKCKAVIQKLLGAGADQPKWVRIVALRHLSEIGDDSVVSPVAKLLANPELQEEAVFCLERIPGKAATMALINSGTEVNEDFIPRLLAALGHRRAEEAADICAQAMKHPNMKIAMAGMKALGRIGVKPTVSAKPPEFDSLPPGDQIDFMDSALRYADAQVEQGNLEDAAKVYSVALGREEEHWQCAAIIGIAKIPDPRVTEVISSKLTSGSNQVRITAEKALAALKKPRG
jgi:HEAT repeat protein